MRIDYAQCWEDPSVLSRALALTHGDDVLSVASGGDNSIAMLLDNARSVTVIDRNSAQLHLVELKIAALRTLDYDDFVSFLGAHQCRHRQRLYGIVRKSLSPQASHFWNQHAADIDAGVIHTGRLERFLSIFRRYVLPLVQSRRSIAAFLASTSIDEQAHYYGEHIDSLRWRILFMTVFNRPLLSRFGRCQGAFSQVGQVSVASELLARATRGLTQIPVHDNFLVRYALTGSYDLDHCAPPYLQLANFLRLRERIHRLRLVRGDLVDFLKSSPVGAYSAFNLSDALEYMDRSQVNEVARALTRVARDDSRAAFWTMFNTRPVPDGYHAEIAVDPVSAGVASRDDRGIFYGSFNLWCIHAAIDRFDQTFARIFGTEQSS